MGPSIALLALLLSPAPASGRLALDGLDPVALCGGVERAGSPELVAIRGRYTYRFADAGSRARFLDEPERFAIQWGGGCARMGPLSGAGDPARYALHDGRLFIFASDACRAGFLKAPERFVVERAELAPFDEARRAAGAAWIEKAAAAHGGAQRIAAARGLLLMHEGEQQGWTWRLEQSLGPAGGMTRRSRWTPPEGEGEPSETTWRLAESATGSDGGERFAVTSPDQLEDLRRLAQREPLVLLWARGRPDFVAGHLGPGRLGEREVEEVEVRLDGLSTTLLLDPASARILGLRWRGRPGEGVTREVVETFVEGREVEGLSLPLAREVLADGEPRPSFAPRWTSAEVVTEPPAGD